MSISSEITRILGGKSSLKSGLNEILPDGHKIGNNETIDEYASHLEYIETGGGGGGQTTIDVTINGSSAIICAELPNVTLKLYNSADTLLATQTTNSTTGGVVTFSVSANGTYTVKAYNSSDELLWTNTVTISQVGTYNVKSGKALNNYTWAEIKTASTNGYAKYMWSVGDKKQFVQSGSILHNYWVVIIGFEHDVLASDGISLAGITFMFEKCYTSSSYNINMKLYLNGSSTYRNVGGYRGSLMRQRFQAQGEDCYSQASGVTATLLASGFKYYDGTACPLYSYTESTDTFANASADTFSTSKVYFVKGYYKSFGTINEEDFVEGKFFIYNSNGYTVPSSWASGQTYYCIYPTLQENGVFYGALSSLMEYIRPVLKTQSCGNQSTKNCTTTEKVWNLAVEEIFGVNKDVNTDQGTSAQNIYAYNTAGEGTIYDYFKNNFRMGKIGLGNAWWTRSPSTYSCNNWILVDNYGTIYYYYVNYTDYVRPCFCI